MKIRDIPPALLIALMASPSLAQNVDFDAAMSGGFTQLAYGIGAKSLITAICSVLFLYGMGHERWLICVCAVIGAVLYFGSGVILGRMGIV